MRGRTFVLLLLTLLLAVPVASWLAIRSLDGGYWRGLVADRVMAATGRKLTIAGPAAISWSLAPTVVVDEVALANAPGAASPTLVKVGRLELRLHLSSLLGGHLEIDRLFLRDVELDLERDAGGIGNWHLRSTAPPQGEAAGEEGGSFPIVREAVLEGGSIRYRSRNSKEIATIAIKRGRLDRVGADEAARVDVSGSLDGVPASLQGRLAKVEDLLSGALEEADLGDLRFKLGNTTLSGSANLNWAPGQTILRADLTSKRLDLATFLNPKGTAAGKVPERPEGALDILTALDADVRVRAGTLLVAGHEMKNVDATSKLRSGRLEIAPLTLELFGSPLRGTLLLDGSSNPDQVALQAAADALDVGRLLAGFGVTQLIDGRGDLRLQLRGRGQSPQAWRAGSEGWVRFLMNNGRMRTQLVDQLAGGLRQLLGALAGGGTGDGAAIRCAALNVPVAKGVAHPDLVLDTDFTTLVAHGTVDLGRDRLDLVLSPQAKSLDLNLAVPVTVRGPIAEPSFGLDEGDAARRLVSLLGSVVFPPAAIGAFVDFGSAKSNGCLALAANPKQPAPAAEPSVGDAVDVIKDTVEGAGQQLLDLLTPSR